MIKKLIENKKIEIFFQPIISVKNKKIFAFEALTRAYDENNDLISPIYLFEHARKENQSTMLDSYVRELAVKKFYPYYKQNNDLLLFLNFESSIIDCKKCDSFAKKVIAYKIPPQNIVIEIKEDSIKDNELLTQFVKNYKELGFNIAIDDFGIGYSSFDRLALIRPSIVKVDRSIIYDIHNNFINSEILNAISKMCHNIGALVLAEGVEEKSEILSCIQKDIDIFQGFYFCKPLPNISKEKELSVLEIAKTIGDEYKEKVNQYIVKQQRLVEDSQKITNKVFHILSTSTEKYHKKTKELLQEHKKLEAIYLIDYHSGLQTHDTIIQSRSSTLFSPSLKGDDHSLKEYYFIAKRSFGKNYLSEKYISKASGNLCRTYSCVVNINAKEYILCLDIKIKA